MNRRNFTKLAIAALASPLALINKVVAAAPVGQRKYVHPIWGEFLGFALNTNITFPIESVLVVEFLRYNSLVTIIYFNYQSIRQEDINKIKSLSGEELFAETIDTLESSVLLLGKFDFRVAASVIISNK